jgi:hypothetical protein
MESRAPFVPRLRGGRLAVDAQARAGARRQPDDAALIVAHQQAGTRAVERAALVPQLGLVDLGAPGVAAQQLA